MRKYLISLLGLFIFTVGPAAHAAPEWIEGKHYFLIEPAQPTSVPAGKVEVTEVFSYGCPACDHFQPMVQRLKTSLPANAELVYVPASFNPSEGWPMFQRAFFAASALGIAEKTHAAMFKAVWGTGELAVSDPRTRRLKNPLPSIEDAAKFYANTAGVKPEQFIAVAKSFSVDFNMKRADEWIKSCRVDQTPTMIVNGKYRLTVGSAGGNEQLIDLVKWLVAKESGQS